MCCVTNFARGEGHQNFSEQTTTTMRKINKLDNAFFFTFTSPQNLKGSANNAVHPAQPKITSISSILTTGIRNSDTTYINFLLSTM